MKPDGLFLILELELMHFAHEVLEPESLKSAEEKDVFPKELEMAKALINAITADSEPTKYKDQYQTAVMQMIEEKAQNRAVSEKPIPVEAPSNVVDLVAVLQQSIQKASGVRKEQPGKKAGTLSTAVLVKQRCRAV